MKVHRRHNRDKPKMFAGLAEPVATPSHGPRFPPTPKPRTAHKLGSRYMRELGRRGGRVNVATHGVEQMARIGAKGGAHPKK